MKALDAAALGLHWSSIMIILYEVMLWLHYGYVMVMLWLLLWLLHQPGERLCNGSHVFQKIINLSAVSTVPGFFFQHLSSCLAYSGFSQQCIKCE